MIHSSHDEIPMSLSELRSIIDKANELLSKFENLPEGEDVPAWIQSKITKAEDYLASVCRAFDSELDQQREEHGDHKRAIVKVIEMAKIHAAFDKGTRDALIEAIAAVEHEAWVSWAASVADEVSAERRAKFKEGMVPYEQLDESTKDISRTWAKDIVDAIEPILSTGGKVKEIVTKIEVDAKKFPSLHKILKTD